MARLQILEVLLLITMEFLTIMAIQVNQVVEEHLT